MYGTPSQAHGTAWRCAAAGALPSALSLTKAGARHERGRSRRVVGSCCCLLWQGAIKAIVARYGKKDRGTGKKQRAAAPTLRQLSSAGCGSSRAICRTSRMACRAGGARGGGSRVGLKGHLDQ